MKNTLGLATLALSLAACASLVPPSSEEIATLPVISYGQAAPEGKNFILHYPAGVALPVDTSVRGNLFEKDEAATLKPRLKKDIYIYRQWASLDSKKWVRSNDLVVGNIEFRLPGEKDTQSPGALGVEFNLK